MPDSFSPAVTSELSIGGTLFRWGERTYIMGILNATPDSFSGDGVDGDLSAAVRRAEQIEAEGADLLDLGGESTRPGHHPVTVEEELRRVLPVLRAIRASVSIPISIDTSKFEVAEAALVAGARLINDVSGLAERRLGDLAAAANVPLVLMACARHAVEEVVPGVRLELETLVERALACGLSRSQLVIDPGFGFGKAPPANLALLRGLKALLSLQLPLLAGLSRKSTIAAVLGPEGQRSEAANAALTTLAITGGADVIRVHDVAAMRRAAQLVDAAWRVPKPEGAVAL